MSLQLDEEEFFFKRRSGDENLSNAIDLNVNPNLFVTDKIGVGTRELSPGIRIVTDSLNEDSFEWRNKGFKVGSFGIDQIGNPNGSGQLELWREGIRDIYLTAGPGNPTFFKTNSVSIGQSAVGGKLAVLGTTSGINVGSNTTYSETPSPAGGLLVQGQTLIGQLTGTEKLEVTGNIKATGTITGSNTASVIDDGTFYVFYLGIVKLFKINKTTGQMQVSGGYDSDITL